MEEFYFETHKKDLVFQIEKTAFYCVGLSSNRKNNVVFSIHIVRMKICFQIL